MKNVIITNQAELDKKIAAIKADGRDSLHVVSDFDRTLTKAFSNGEKTPSLISHLRNGNYLTEEYAEKAHQLFNKYHPIELSKTISKEEKKKAMKKWWTSHYKILVECGLDEKTIKLAVKDLIMEEKIKLRDGAKEFFEILGKNNIPLIILSSAGIGNMVTEFLKEQNLMLNNIHFIGNTLEFSRQGKFTGIKDNKIIHVLNKNEAEMKSLPIYKEIKKRENVILIGDSLDDLAMIKGFKCKNIIKIIFASYDEENIEEYKKNFDMIILNDGNFKEINQILNKVL